MATSHFPPSDVPVSDLSNATGANRATAEHPPASKPDPTVNVRSNASSHNTARDGHGSEGGLATTAPTSAAALARAQVRLRNGLRQFPDFPSPGILFEDIMPIFANPALHNDLITALELQVADAFAGATIDIIVGLESRGFLFGPTLALRLGAGFVPVRKRGKLPGPCETASYKKEYGEDFFQLQRDGIQKGQKVLIVDDIIATGGSAAAAGSLVRQVGGELVGYLFLMELDFLKGRAKLDAPVHTLLTGQEEKSQS